MPNHQHNLSRRALAVGVIAISFLAGCHKTSVQSVATSMPGEMPAERSNVGLEYSLNANQGLVRQEVLLHASLYQAAYETNVGDFTRHYLLEPVHEPNPPQLGIEAHEFKSLVLAELKALERPFAWVEETWRINPGAENFPGTSERATRLRIKIFSRDENSATIKGEIGDWTADVGSSRQGVTATWDGVQWNIERDRVRLVW